MLTPDVKRIEITGATAPTVDDESTASRTTGVLMLGATFSEDRILPLSWSATETPPPYGVAGVGWGGRSGS